MIETFLRVAYPEHFPPGTLLGPFRNLCEQYVSRSAEIPESCNLVEYAKRFHHHTTPAWEIEKINDSELLDFVNRTHFTQTAKLRSRRTDARALSPWYTARPAPRHPAGQRGFRVARRNRPAAYRRRYVEITGRDLREPKAPVDISTKPPTG